MVSSPSSNHNLRMAGSIEDRGKQEMKGVGEPVRVYAVRVMA